MKLKELRKKAGLTQVELADKLQIKRITYNKYEIGENLPNIPTIKKIAKFYNVSLDYLLENETVNQIDMSEFSDEKKELLNLIVTQDNKTCNRLHAVVFGYLTSYHETKQSFNPFRNFKE